MLLQAGLISIKKDYIKFAETEAQGPGLWNSDMGMTYKSLKRK